MSPFWNPPAGWLLHTAVGGGLILLLTAGLVRRVRQPALRQRLGEMGLAAALVGAVLSLGPAWLPLPLLAPAEGEPAPKVEADDEPAALAEDPLPDEPDPADRELAWADDAFPQAPALPDGEAAPPVAAEPEKAARAEAAADPGPSWDWLA